MRPTLRWLRSYAWRGLLLGLLLSFGLLNVLAYRHARAMTHFVPAGDPPAKPEALSIPQKLAVLFTGVKIPRPSSTLLPQDRGLAYATHTFPGRRGRLEAWYIPHPRPRGIVLLFHGYAACKAQLLPEAEALMSMGYACFLVDFRGSGGSEGDETTVGYYEAEDVDVAVKYVREQWHGLPVILLGRSMGSAAILRALAIHGTQADAPALECPFDRMLSTVQARFAQMGIPSFPCARLLLFWGDVQLDIDGFQHNPVDYAAAVKCPVLLLHGDKDPTVSVEQTAAIFENLHGRKELHTFVGLGHEAYLRREPEEWKTCVRQFLGS
jgi:alpha-beta hydrolase superfamily lysophospholipase